MDYQRRMQKANEHAEKIKWKQEINSARHINDKKKQLSFSKVAFIFMMANCMIIEIYSLVVMFMFRDLSSLPSLISAIIGECVTMMGYFVKSCKENTAGGIVYESAMYNIRNDADNAPVG